MPLPHVAGGLRPLPDQAERRRVCDRRPFRSGPPQLHRRLVATDDGEKRAELELDATPVFHGMAAANG